MKKVMSLVMIIVTLFCTTCAMAEEYDALIAEKEELCQALWFVEDWREVVLPTGTYEVGKDIPGGKWTFWAYDYGRPQIQYAAKLMPGGASMHATNDVEKSETVVSPKRDFFDPERDDYFFDIELENGKYICIKYGTALMNNDDDNRNFEFSNSVNKELLTLSADEIRNRINEIDEKLKQGEYLTYVLEAGRWTVGKEIPEGIYEARAEKQNRTQIVIYDKTLATTFYDGSVLLSNIYDPNYEEFEIADDDTVEYLVLEDGMEIEVREHYGNTVFSTFIGKEPLEFVTDPKDEEKEGHSWEIKKEKTTQDLMMELYAACASFSDDDLTMECSYNYKGKVLKHLYTLEEYEMRDFQGNSGRKMKQAFVKEVKNDLYPALEDRIQRDVGESLAEYDRSQFDIIVQFQTKDEEVIVTIENGKIID